jgi:hypothetical protein
VTFQQAVCRTPDLGAAAFQPGLQALGNHSRRIQCADARRLTGSVALDDRLASTYPNDPRWDYGIGLREARGETAIRIEVHPASTGEVEAVLNKLRWLKDWLRIQAPKLHRLTAAQAYYWLATGGVHIRPGSPQARRLQSAGLFSPRNRLMPLPFHPFDSVHLSRPSDGIAVPAREMVWTDGCLADMRANPTGRAIAAPCSSVPRCSQTEPLRPVGLPDPWSFWNRRGSSPSSRSAALAALEAFASPDAGLVDDDHIII